MPWVVGLFVVTLLGGCSTLESPGFRLPRYYTVQAGDTLESILERFDVDPLELIRVNKIENPDHIKPGQQLYLPWDVKRLIDDYEVSRQAYGARGDRDSALERELKDDAPDFFWPLDNTEVSSYFGWRGKRRLHEGIDLRADVGTPVMAAAGGEVIYAGSRLKGYGRTVIIDHGNDWYTLYAHCSQLFVRVGQRVRAGDKIALTGKSGRSKGPHLHFEIRKGSDPLDPLRFLK